MKKFFISLLIFFLTCITELSYLIFWIGTFFVAATWPSALTTVRTQDPATGLAAIFICVAGIVVPLFTGTVFGFTLLMLKKRQSQP